MLEFLKTALRRFIVFILNALALVGVLMMTLGFFSFLFSLGLQVEDGIGAMIMGAALFALVSLVKAVHKLTAVLESLQIERSNDEEVNSEDSYPHGPCSL